VFSLSAIFLLAGARRDWCRRRTGCDERWRRRPWNINADEGKKLAFKNAGGQPAFNGEERAAPGVTSKSSLVQAAPGYTQRHGAGTPLLAGLWCRVPGFRCTVWGLGLGSRVVQDLVVWDSAFSVRLFLSVACCVNLPHSMYRLNCFRKFMERKIQIRTVFRVHIRFSW